MSMITGTKTREILCCITNSDAVFRANEIAR